MLKGMCEKKSLQLEGAAVGGLHQPFFSLFVPTYNRRQLLPRLLESVEAQTFQDFELLIVDDGSQDDTYEFLCSYQPRGNYQLRVFYQENQGRHIAFNTAFEQARGFLFTTINSDDTLAPNALERFAYWWDYAQKHYPETPIVGVEALCAKMETGDVVGTPFPESPMIADPIEMRFLHGVYGDKVRAVRTDIITRYRFPQFPGEKYIHPTYLWFRLGFDHHKYLYFNEILSYKEYLAEGITKNRVVTQGRSPRGVALYFKEFVELAYRDGRVPHNALVNYTADWVRYALYTEPLPQVMRETWQRSRSKLVWLKAVPRGIWRWRRDQRILANTPPKQ